MLRLLLTKHDIHPYLEISHVQSSLSCNVHVHVDLNIRELTGGCDLIKYEP